MKNMLKRSLAAVMAVAPLAVGMVGMSASAVVKTDPYSKFEYNRYSMSADCSLTNMTQKNRYAQVSIRCYTMDGTEYDGNYDPSLGYDGEVSCTHYSSKVITGAEFYGTLYFNTQPVGTPTSSWHETL